MTIREIAKLAGVSVSTVSKIMNGKDESISSETRARVLALAKEYHYTPYASAIASNIRSLTIGILFSSLKNIDMTLKGVLAAAQEFGYRLTIYVSDDEPETEYKHISSLIASRVDGLLWETTEQPFADCETALIGAKIPTLIFNSEHPDSVNMDYPTIAYEATKLLIDRSHTEIGCLLTNGRRTNGVYDGYRKCLFDHGIPFHSELVFFDVNQNLMSKIAARSVSGLVSSHYSSTLALYEQLRTLHYILPYDFSLVSLKDDSHDSIAFPQISSFPIPHYEFGQYICRLLISRLESSTAAPPMFAPVLTASSPAATIDIPYNARNRQILVIGSINIDNYLSVDTLPHSGKAVISSVAHQYPGGKGMNQAVGVSRLGHRASLIGSLGSDLDSDTIYASVSHYHINPKGVCRYAGSKTGQAYIFVQKDGNSMISIMSGANSCLSPQYILENESLFDHTAFCLMQSEIPIDALETACRVAHVHQVQTIVKPVACDHLPDSLLAMTDYLVPNEDELAELCPQYATLEERVDHLLRAGVQTVIVTLGSNGCYVKNRSLQKYYPAADFRATDSSGACDAFISAFASYLLYGYDLDAAIQIATYAAGFSVTRQGVVPSLIDKNTLEAYIRQNNPSLLHTDSLS